MEKLQKHEWVFIINPAAGNGYAQSMRHLIEDMIRKYAVNARVVLSEKVGHSSELAKQYADAGAEFIVGVGGDGTLNELGAALLNRTGVTLGLVPAGTGNDFIQILGFPDRFEEEHWAILFDKNIIRMDVGICNGKAFFNGMGLGFDAQVASENYTEPGEVKKGGKNKYLYHIIKTLLFYKEKRMTVVSNGNTSETDCFINTVSVGRRFAGGFFLTPEAIANDGLLDVCMIRKLNLLQRFRILPMVPRGTHLKDPKVNYYKTSDLTIEFSREVPYHLDGELFFAKHFDISISSASLPVLYNPAGDHFFINSER